MAEREPNAAPAADAASTGDTSTWKANIQEAVKLQQKLEQTTATNNNAERRLENVANDIALVQSRLLAKESDILNGPNADTLQQYREAKDRLESLQIHHTNLSTTVTEQTEELAQLTHRLDVIKKSIKDKGRRMTDNTPLIRIKTAIQTLKEEMHDMDVRIGILSHLLLQSQLAMVKRKARGVVVGSDDEFDSDDDDEEDDLGQ